VSQRQPNATHTPYSGKGRKRERKEGRKEGRKEARDTERRNEAGRRVHTHTHTHTHKYIMGAHTYTQQTHTHQESRVAPRDQERHRERASRTSKGQQHPLVHCDRLSSPIKVSHGVSQAHTHTHTDTHTLSHTIRVKQPTEHKLNSYKKLSRPSASSACLPSDDPHSRVNTLARSVLPGRTSLLSLLCHAVQPENTHGCVVDYFDELCTPQPVNTEVLDVCFLYASVLIHRHTRRAPHSATFRE